MSRGAKGDQDNKEKEESTLGDLFKRISTLGAAATEENIKNIIKDLPIAKDVVHNLVQNAKGARGEFSKVIQDEFRKYLGKVELEKIVDYVAEHYNVDVKAQVSLKKKKPESDKSSSSTPDSKLRKDGP